MSKIAKRHQWSTAGAEGVAMNQVIRLCRFPRVDCAPYSIRLLLRSFIEKLYAATQECNAIAAVLFVSKWHSWPHTCARPREAKLGSRQHFVKSVIAPSAVSA